MTFQNPFFVGGPVPSDFFIWRSYEIKIAFDTICKRSHLAIYSNSGFGKSSLLKYLTSPQSWTQQGQDPSKAFIVYLNCSEITPFTPDAFWRNVLNLLKDEVESDVDFQTEINSVLQDEKVEKSGLRKILRKIGQQDKFLLLLIDDYDKALYANDQYTEAEMLTFLSEFRNLAVHSKEGQYLSTIVASFRRLNELGPKLKPSGSPWYNQYLFQLLKPLSPSVVNDHLRMNMSSDLRGTILKVVDGHPALVQNAGYLLHNYLQDQNNINIETFIRDFITATEHYFHDTWEFSTSEEQVLLMLIALCRLEGRLGKKQYALNDVESIFSQRSRELIDLEERGVIQHTIEDGKMVYGFASILMEWWVIQEIGNSNESKLEKQEKVCLNLMSRQQMEKVSQVFKQIWDHKEDFISSIKWISNNCPEVIKSIINN